MPASIGNITVDCVDPSRAAAFWAEALGYRHEGAGEGWASVISPASRHPRLYFQRVPERKTVKNRLHLDLNAGDLGAEVERLVGLGAIRGLDFQKDGEHWVTMLDPEGNEFCVQPE